MAEKILGLDLGTNSIGWAITETTENGYKLLDKGVDIFQEGVNRTKSGEEPMVKIRTMARGHRRLYKRRRLRKIELLKVLIANNLCPYLSETELSCWRYQKIYPMNEEFIKWQQTDDKVNKNPYYDRYTALNSKLDLTKETDRFLLGRALYHISQRRGFLSNRKDQTDAKSKGEVISGINQVSEEIKEYDCEYLGEHFYKLYNNGEKIRNKYTARKEHYEKEFYAICKFQNIDESLVKALYRAIFYQRPLKSQKGLVGNCTFAKNKSRCPISHPRFEEFRMLSFINNIKIHGPYDTTYRALTLEEIEKIKPLFYRKSKAQFDFEDIAKVIAGKKELYAYKDDKCDAPYKFNYRMSQSVAGCPVTASLMNCFGKDWISVICSLYTKANKKTDLEIIHDVWHVLYSFDDNEKLQNWAEQNLQLSQEEAEEFIKIHLPGEYASLSLNAINKILPYLQQRYRFDEAVFLANLQCVVTKNIWVDEEKQNYIIEQVAQTISNYVTTSNISKENAIFQCLLDCGLSADEFNENKLYHPSMIETYQVAKPNKDGITLLGSPRTNSVRNPMAMRALFRLRALVNQLIKEGKIDKNTKINIEFARSLNNFNKRRAIEQIQRENETEHLKYANLIKEIYKEETKTSIEPTDDDILKYKLWEEQKHKCLYTGDEIRISDFIGPNPRYDIEHTIPLSRGGDNSQENKTLCQSRFNRDTKKTKLPTELSNHKDILSRIEQLGWENKISELYKEIGKTKGTFQNKEIKDKMIQKRHILTMRLNYFKGKLLRFNLKEVPEGFANRQGVDVGIISRYARLYLKTVFDKVYTIKGSTTADFRKAWGLQEFDEKKSRITHGHHCIDAIVIACIGLREYQAWAKYISNVEYSRWGMSEHTYLPKPWETFTEDVKVIDSQLLVSHHTPNNMHKYAKKALRIRGKKQYNDKGEVIYLKGDCARGVLHQDTFYGAIKKDNELRYVVRKSLLDLSESDVERIVDDSIKNCIKNEIKELGFKKALSKPICFNKEKGVYIKKVRIYTPNITSPISLKNHRDKSRFAHKCNYYVANESNYCIALYEGLVKGKTKRSFQILKNIDAAKYYNKKSEGNDLVPFSDKNKYPLRHILHNGTMVLFYENDKNEIYDATKEELSKRLYKIIGFSPLSSGANVYGRIYFKHHLEARQSSELKGKNGIWLKGEDYRPIIVLLHSQLKILVEGYDFDLTITGEIKFKH